jgi:hypothetical protein
MTVEQPTYPLSVPAGERREIPTGLVITVAAAITGAGFPEFTSAVDFTRLLSALEKFVYADDATEDTDSHATAAPGATVSRTPDGGISVSQSLGVVEPGASVTGLRIGRL